MKYSVILPCYNEAHNLRITLPGLLEAIGQRDDIEVILADNSSTDNSVELAREFGVTTYIFNRVKISKLRNLGAESSSGTYIYFLDADILVPNTIFAALDSFVDESKYDVLGFLDLAPEEAPWFAKTWSLRCLARREKYGEVQWLPGRNIFVPRHYFDLVGGFDETLLTAEDKDFVLRLRKSGARAASDSRLRLVHYGYERTFVEWWRKEFWRQHSHFHLIKQQGIKLRLLRFPMLSCFHLVLLGFIMFNLVREQLPSTFILLIWILPSLLMTLAFSTSRKSWRFPQFLLLYLLRFHIAAVSMIHEGISYFFTFSR